MARISKTTKFLLWAIPIFAIIFWYVTYTPEKPASGVSVLSGPAQTPVQRAPEAAAPTKATLNDMKADFEGSERAFREDYGKMKADSLLENLSPLRPDLDSFLADDSDMHDRTRVAYIECLGISSDSTAQDNCYTPQFFIRSTYTHFGIEQTLRKLPDVSAAAMAKDNLGWMDTVAIHRAKAGAILLDITNDPALAWKNGIDIDTAKTLIAKIDQLQGRAVWQGDDVNPVQTWILLSHADLLLDDFDFRAWKFSLIMRKSKPMQP
jgi:hypothetical protein